MPRYCPGQQEGVDPTNMRLINRTAKALTAVARGSGIDPLFVACAFRRAAAALSGEHIPEPRLASRPEKVEFRVSPEVAER